MKNKKIGFILKIFFAFVFILGLRSSVLAYDTISSGGKVGYKLYSGETFATSSYSIINNSGKSVYLGGAFDEFNSFVTKPPTGVTVTMPIPTTASILSVSPNPINIGLSTTWSWTTVVFASRYEANCIDPTIGSWSGWNSLNSGANLLSSSGIPAAVGTWQCKVRGCNTSGCGPESGVASLVVNPLAPATPTNLTVSPSITATSPNSIQPITFSWTAVIGATKYQYTCDNWVSTGETINSYISAGTVPPTTYACSFRACNGVICGTAATLSNIIVKSSAPSGFTKSPTSPTTADSIIYSWGVVPGAVSYQASINGGVYSALGSTCNATTCSLNGGTALAGSYIINLKACNSSAVCGETSAISFTVTSFTPSAPTGLTYNPTAPNSIQTITLSWSAVTGASSYKYSCDSFTTSAETTGTLWSIGVAPAGTYTCGVKACSGTSCGAPTYKAITVTQFIPTAPTGLYYSPAAPNFTQAITFGWSAVTGATSYKYSCNNFSTSAETTNTSVNFGTVPAGTYTCGVKACSGTACSAATSKAVTTSCTSVTSWGTNCDTFCASKGCAGATLWYNTYTNNLCTLGKSANTSLAGGNFTISAGACINVPPYAKAYSCVCN